MGRPDIMGVSPKCNEQMASGSTLCIYTLPAGTQVEGALPPAVWGLRETTMLFTIGHIPSPTDSPWLLPLVERQTLLKINFQGGKYPREATKHVSSPLNVIPQQKY